MNSEDIDDLFRQKLDGHASPAADDLWARLQLPSPEPEAAAEPLDTLFRAGLNTHATPPRRELWERLEDEHLRPQPRRRRVAAWWQYSAAAVLLLLLLAGGAGLWRGALGSQDHELATSHPQTAPTPQRSAPASPRPSTLTAQDLAATTLGGGTTANQAAAQAAPTAPKKNQQIFSSQATARWASTSSTPMATTSRPRRAAADARAAGSHRQQPDAAAGQLASTGKRRPASQSLTTPPTLDNQTPTHAPAPILAVATPATATPDIIEVEVRRGPAPTAAPATAPVLLTVDNTPAPARRRLRLGSLLRQADHLVHGESVNLAEASDPTEAITLQARLGGRVLSKTIRL